MSTTNVYGTLDNQVGNLNGLFKDVYASKMKDLIPDHLFKLMSAIKFGASADRLGNLFNQPVVLGLEHGITFADSADDAFALNPPVAGQIKNAQVRGNPKVLSSYLGYSAASRAASGKEAFMEATKFLVGNMVKSITKKLEIEMLYGQVGYGTVASVASSTVTIATAEWAPGIWAGAEKMPIEIRDVTGATSRGDYVVQSVNLELRTITLTSAPVGVVATDVIWHKGAYGKEFAGIHKIITNTGSLFGISATDYNLWKGNEYSASSGALSFTKINNALARAVEKGLEGKVLCLVNPRAWANVNSDQAALRKYDGSYSTKKLENGTQSLVFYSQNGEIEIQPSIYVKEGYAYVLAIEEWMRVGSSDVSFKMPGDGDQFIRHRESSAALELRIWTDQALFCSKPGLNCLIKDVVNSN
jgi:hypothetical protein